MAELSTLPEGVAVVRDIRSCIMYHGTQSAFIAAGIIKPEWLEGLGNNTRQVVLDENGHFTMMQRGVGNWVTHKQRRLGAYSIKRLQNSLLEITVYRTPAEAATMRHDKLAAAPASTHLETLPKVPEILIPAPLVDRFMRLSHAGRIHACAVFTRGIIEAEGMYPSERQLQISARRSSIRLAWQNPSQPQMRTPGATHPAIVIDGASRKPA